MVVARLGNGVFKIGFAFIALFLILFVVGNEAIQRAGAALFFRLCSRSRGRLCSCSLLCTRTLCGHGALRSRSCSALTQPCIDAAHHQRSTTIAIKSKNLFHRTVNEGAVVADHHHNAGPVIQVILECAQCVKVKIVGGFVEQQNIGLFNESEKKLQTTAFTT